MNSDTRQVLAVEPPDGFVGKVDLDLWPRPGLSVEAFLAMAKAKNARVGSCISQLTSKGWRPVLTARWKEGGCNVVLHGPPDTRS